MQRLSVNKNCIDDVYKYSLYNINQQSVDTELQISKSWHRIANFKFELSNVSHTRNKPNAN